MILAIAFHPTAVLDPLDATWIAAGAVLGVALTLAVQYIARHRQN